MLLVLLLLAVLALNAQTEYSLTAAERELSDGDYVHAAEILDSLEARAVVSPEFYLALGNARFEAGRYGPAVLAYERGLRLRPGDRDLKNNLTFVREEAGIASPTLPGFFLLGWWRSSAAFLGTTAAYSIGLVLWWLAVAGALWWYLRRTGMDEKRRFALLPVSAVCAGLAVVFFLLAYDRHTFLQQTDEAILLKPATLRVSPSPEGSVEAELTEGYKLSITDRVNRYVKVRLEDGRQGYLRLEAIESI